MNKVLSRSPSLFGLCFIGTFCIVALVHYPLLRLPYYWDEAGYYIPAALDFFHLGLLVPVHTLPTGHTPLVSVYLALLWWLLGYSTLVSRLAMVAFAAATLVALYLLGRTTASRETALWACILLALSPLFFAQSSLVFLDLPAAFATTMAIWALLRRRMDWFAVAASISVLTKETAVVIVPVALAFGWRTRKHLRKVDWLWLAAPAFPLAVWAVYYHHITGFWTGNPQYLQYNLYSTLTPGRIAISLVRRFYEVIIGGFNWLLVVVALLGYRQIRKARAHPDRGSLASNEATAKNIRHDFFFLATSLVIVYIAMLSAIGGAVLPRYLLPIFPCFYLALTMLAGGLPRRVKRSALVLVAACFVASWFINPPYPFPYEDNLSYADFIHLHQQAAHMLSSLPGNPRVLTAWPATDELDHPKLGYVKKRLRVKGVKGFTPQDFKHISANSFDLLYLYSRKWNPPDNWLRCFPLMARVDEYSLPVSPAVLVKRFHLHLLAVFRLHGQWVRIYARHENSPPTPSP